MFELVASQALSGGTESMEGVLKFFFARTLQTNSPPDPGCSAFMYSGVSLKGFALRDGDEGF